jgi:hypothetical protein
VSGEPWAVRLCRGWVNTYTRGLPAEIGERRLLEIESDLWDHLHDPGTADREILGRTLRGIHADVWWRYRTLLDQRGARQRSHVMTTTTRNWWTPVTTVIGVVVATMGSLGLVFGETTSGSGGALILAAAPPAVGGLLILAGLATRRQQVIRGSWLVITGAALAAFDPIFIPFTAVVIIGGLWTGNLAISDEQVDTVRLAATRRSMTDRWYRWILASAALVAFGFATLVFWENSGVVPDDCTEANPCWEGSAAWATWVIAWFAAIVTGGIGVVLGVLRVLTRHHTRPA